jgi:hypothetical protein
MATVITFAGLGDSITLDAATSQQHDRSAEITRHRVERGADVTDHVRPGPLALTVNGVMAAAPPRSVLESGFASLTGDEKRHRRAWDRLQEAMDKSELCTVDTSLHVYPNMAIKGLSTPREASTGDDVVLSIQFEEVRFVEAATVQVPKDAFGKAPSVPGQPAPGRQATSAAVAKTQRQASPAASKGAAPKVTPKPQQAARGKSVLSMLTGFGG